MRKSLSNLILGAGLVGSTFFAAVGVNAEADKWIKADYVNHCGSCHGAGGAGDGPMADQLKGKPTDLTLLAKNNGGNFPYRRVYRTIDGTWNEGTFRAHGSDKMPIWGDVFRREASTETGYMEAKGRIMAIIQYIDTLQKK